MSSIHLNSFQSTEIISMFHRPLNAPKFTIFNKKVNTGLILNSKKARLSTGCIPIPNNLSICCTDFVSIILKVLTLYNILKSLNAPFLNASSQLYIRQILPNFWPESQNMDSDFDFQSFWSNLKIHFRLSTDLPKSHWKTLIMTPYNLKDLNVPKTIYTAFGSLNAPKIHFFQENCSFWSF